MKNLEGQLPKLEIGAYFCCWIGAVFYSIYQVKEASIVFKYVDDVYNDLSDGWGIIGRRKDTSDYEWETFKDLLILLFPWLIFHIIISEYLRISKLLSYLPFFHIIITIFYVIYNFNIKVLFFMLYQPFIFEIFSKFNSKLVIWTCGLFNLLLLHCYKDSGLNETFLNIMNISEVQHNMTVLAIYWINLRCLSYYLDKIESLVSKNVVFIFAYCLYLPLIYFGPFILYANYEKCQHNCDITLMLRIKFLFQNILRYTFWFLITEIILHYIYVNAFSFQTEIVEQFDSWTLYGYGYCMGQFFHMKYVILYGISTSLAKFDNIPVPSIPKCIGRIHLYSDMWKYFDHGLYIFLLRYIYIPIHNCSKLFKLPANMFCFIFVYLWHGFLQDNILIWVIINCIGVSLENLCKLFYKFHLKNYVHFNGSWERRFGCIIASPLLAVSAISNFYFFAGLQIGNIFFKQLFKSEYTTTLLLYFLYCCGQVSVEIKKWETMKQKIKNI